MLMTANLFNAILGIAVAALVSFIQPLNTFSYLMITQHYPSQTKSKVQELQIAALSFTETADPHREIIV